jgi:enoyl-CoA hydratase
MAAVEFESRGSVGVITINRPEKRNAVDGGIARGIEDSIDRLEADEEMRVGILRAAMRDGVRPVFCSGHDLSGGGGVDDPSITERGGFAGITRRERTKPLIAAVDGLATAGGCEIALACDIIVASHRAAFALAETKWNLVPGAGGMFRLTRLVGRMVADDMLLTGDELSAQRAFQLGLVSRLAEDGNVDALAMEVALKISGNGPRAVQLSRKASALAEHQDDESAWATTVSSYLQVQATEDVAEGLAAFAARRPPRFTGR